MSHLPPPPYPPPLYPPPPYSSYPPLTPTPTRDIFGYSGYDAAYNAASKAAATVVNRQQQQQHTPAAHPPLYPPPSYPPPPLTPTPTRDIFGYGPYYDAAYNAAAVASGQDKLPEGWRKSVEPETGNAVWVHDKKGILSYEPPKNGGAKNKKKHSCRTKRRRHRRKASRRRTGKK